MPKLNYWKLAGSALLTWYFISYILGNPLRGPGTWNFVDNVDLIIHEAGHFIFIFFGEFMQILGGSFLQVALPIVFAGYFFLQRQYFSGSVVLFWVGQNIINVAVYMGDSIIRQLELLGGGDVIHDWNYLISHMGLLKHVDAISRMVYDLGFFVIIAAAVMCFAFSLGDATRLKIWHFLSGKGNERA